MRTYFVDAFTNQPFKGNPAAVCIIEKNVDPAMMQSIATEIGFSETAFIRNISEHFYSIRFFTPKMEIPLCGHATLASAKIIFDTIALENIVFVNIDNVELKIGKSDERIVMQFPVYDTIHLEVPDLLLYALGLHKIVNSRFSPNNKIILLEIDNAEELASLTPDFTALLDSYQGINGVLVTSHSNDTGFDFHYRYFWPWAGTNEDPVTGGVQTFLTKYWALKFGKNKLEVFQSSSRTGNMTTELMEDKVLIYGQAVIVFDGELKIDIG